jgi:hypothetical protein
LTTTSTTPPIINASERSRTLAWVGGLSVAFALIVVGAILFRFNPSEHGFFPRCFLKSLTGLDCPGCGGLRAMHQLLHGHILAAFQLNPLLLLMLPLAAFYGLRQLICLATGRVLAHPFRNPRWLGVFAFVVVAFGVLRNLPWRSWFGG